MPWPIADRAEDLAKTDQGIDPKKNSEYYKTMERLRKAQKKS